MLNVVDPTPDRTLRQLNDAELVGTLLTLWEQHHGDVDTRAEWARELDRRRHAA